MSAALAAAPRPAAARPAFRSTASEPSPFAPDTEWAAWRDARRRTLPAGHYDPAYLTSHALERLPAVCGAMGCGDAVRVLDRPLWWPPTGLSEEFATFHGLRSADGKPVLAVRLTPDSYALLFLDRSTGAWDVPTIGKCGPEMVSLGAWRWGVSRLDAARRLARLCGLGRLTP